jgi:putative CocE/NonD family hydrolase
MTALSRRTLIIAATSSTLGAGFLRPPPGRANTAASLWAIDAAGLRVTPGPWPTPANLPTDVHFENLRLRMPDGVHINALLYLPQSVRNGRKIGTQLCVEPYRAEPDGWLNTDLIGQVQDGFATLFVDVRGTGGSEGVCPDEYTVAEYDDTVRIIEFLAQQPWSNGAVGMYGISYSAFNSLWTAAAYKPPALKALFVRAGTDNRYTDDIHSPGGIMMMVDGSWALGMITDNATPGAPNYNLYDKAALDRWNTPPWLSVYLRHQLDGPHYYRGSLGPDHYGMLTTPTFLAGGYLDMYQNFVPRIMRHAPAYTQGVLGPWHHSMTWPGPLLNWRKMQSRWFAHYLNGADNGVQSQPRVAYYMPSWRRQTFRDKGAIPGEWRYADSWPDSVFNPPKRLYLTPRTPVSLNRALSADPAPGLGGALGELAPAASALKLRYHPGTGGSSESIGPDSYEGFFGLDSRAEDAWALCFDSEALRDPVEILGFVRAHLFVAATAPIATWIVRVNDLAPDGTSYIVTYGFLNGTHRHSNVTPEPLVPGAVTELVFELFCTGYHFSPGHRIRIAVTNAYFPVVWPSPYPMVTTLFTGGDHASFIALPVLAPSPGLHGNLPILADHIAPGPNGADDEMTGYTLTRDMVHGITSARFQMGPSQIGCEVSDADPAQARLTVKTSERNHPIDSTRLIETRTQGAMTSTRDRFHMDVTCTLLENGKVIREKTWQTDVARQLV